MNPLKGSLIALGTLAALIGCYGAYEQSASINGGYLMIAAPVVALASAVIPYFAEQAWAAGHRFKGVILALILIPAAATVFYAASERVHLAKAGAEAERAALRAAVALAERALEDAKTAAARADADAKTWRSKTIRACDPGCVAKWDAEAKAARGRVLAATQDVTTASGKAAAESPLKSPVWLLPLALDLVAFISIWTGLSLATAAPVSVPVTAPVPAPAPAPDRAAPVLEPAVAKRTTRRAKPKKRRRALGRGFETFLRTGKAIPENVIPLHGHR